MIDLSIVIISYNTKDLTIRCINSIYEFTKGINFEIIVIDNASSDDSVKALEGLKNRIKLIKNKENNGFTGGNNQGIKASKGRYVLLLNSDTYILDNVLSGMVHWMDKNPRIDISSCMLRNEDRSVQGTGGYFPSLLRVFSWMTIQDFPFVDNFIKPFHPQHAKSIFGKGNDFYLKQKELDWVGGTFFFMRREVFENIGYIDDDYFMYTEEVDFCFRAKKVGFKVVYNPSWSIVHLGGASSATIEFPLISEYKGIKLFYKKHYPAWQYPVLRLLLKIGALGRVVLFGILEGRDTAAIYAKAFKQA